MPPMPCLLILLTRHDECARACGCVAGSPDLTSALKQWERRERPLTEHTQRWTRIYGTTMFLPRPLKKAWILIEKHIPWVRAQYVRAANQVPTGCAADAPL